MSESTSRAGDALAVATAACAAIGLLFASAGAQRVSPPTLGLMQYALASGPAVVVAVRARRRGVALPAGGRAWAGVLVHALLIAAALLSEFHALALAPPTTVSFVGRIEVVLTVLLGAVLLAERLTGLEVLGGAVAVAGVLVLRWEAPPELGAGALWALLAAAFFAAGEVAAKAVVRDVPSSMFVGIRSVAMLLVFAAVTSVQALSAGAAFRAPDARAWLAAAGMALFGPLLARTLYFETLRRMPIARAALLMQLQPLFVALIAITLLGARLRGLELAGGALVLAGTVTVVVARRARSRRAEEAARALRGRSADGP